MPDIYEHDFTPSRPQPSIWERLKELGVVIQGGSVDIDDMGRARVEVSYTCPSENTEEVVRLLVYIQNRRQLEAKRRGEG